MLIIVNKGPLLSSSIPLNIRIQSTTTSNAGGQALINGLVLLPRMLRPGVWLFPFHASPLASEVLIGKPIEKRIQVYGLLGQAMARLHSAGIVHGDLTTSNMIFSKGRLYLIDFGLGKFSGKVEDQAVDLHLLYGALKSAHFRHLEEAWKNLLKVYKQNYSKSKEVLKRLEKIGMRRRYGGGNAKEES